MGPTRRGRLDIGFEPVLLAEGDNMRMKRVAAVAGVPLLLLASIGTAAPAGVAA